MPPRLFCFGLGYCAEHLARRLGARGFAVAGTTRDLARKRATLAGVGDDWQLFAFDGREPLADPEAALAGTTHLLHSIMPDDDGADGPVAVGAQIDPVLRWHGDAIAALQRAGTLRWIGYLSTTGVYGDHGGAWVDEDSPRRPSKARTRRRVVAEDQWLQRGATVFRLAGIYGPGRSALERVEAGAVRVIKPGKVFNRVHVDDIATILEASIVAPPQPGQAFNVADGNPAAGDEVLAHAAALLGLPPPPPVPFEAAQLSPIARSFWQDDLRVDSRRVRERLGVTLAHPDYRAGLLACLRARAPVET